MIERHQIERFPIERYQGITIDEILDRRARMRTYDGLEPEVRKALQEAWANHDPMEILQAMRHYGISAQVMIQIITNTDKQMAIAEPMVQGPKK